MKPFSSTVSFAVEAVRRIEKPCADLDLDCLALDGVVPFGDYERCYIYFPERGRCPFSASRPRSEDGA